MSSGSTSNYSLAYPVPTDPVNVAGDIKSLANDIDAFLTAPAFINNLAIDGGSLVTDAVSANLFNTNATTLNIGGATTALTIGATSGTTTIRNDVSLSSSKVYKINGTSVLSSDTLGSGVTESSLTSLGTVSTGTWNATTIAVNKGGTGLTSYTAGDIVYASGSTTLAKLAGVATGNALISGGVGTAPSWGKIGLTTHVSGTLPIANGGTGVTSTPTNGQLLIGDGTGFSLTTITAGDNIVITNAAGSITIDSTGGGGGGTIVYQPTAPTVDIQTGTMWVDSDGEADMLNANDFYTKTEIDELLSGAGVNPFLLMGA